MTNFNPVEIFQKVGELCKQHNCVYGISWNGGKMQSLEVRQLGYDETLEMNREALEQGVDMLENEFNRYLANNRKVNK